MKYKFSKMRSVSNINVKVRDYVISQLTHFKYLGFVIQIGWMQIIEFMLGD